MLNTLYYKGSKFCTFWCGRNTICEPLSCENTNPRQCLKPKTTTTKSVVTKSSLCDESYVPLSNKCIRIFPEPATWLSALITCAQNGGNLLSIVLPGDQDVMRYITGTWIGLSDIQGEGHFFWSDGSSLNFTNWRRNQPNNAGGNQHCVVVRHDGFWDDVKCSRLLPFVCQKQFNSS